MSSDGKLKRLGLWRLRDKPEELEKALEKIVNGEHARAPEATRPFHDKEEVKVFKNAILSQLANINMNVAYESEHWDFTQEEYKIIRDIYFEVLDAAMDAVYDQLKPTNTLEFKKALTEEQLKIWNRKIEIIEAARMLLECNTQRVLDLPDLLPRKVIPFSIGED